MHDHKHREDLAGEHPYGDLGQLLLLLIFLAAWILDSFFLKYSTFASKYISFPIRLALSALVFFASIYAAKASHDRLFREVREIPHVVREGIFRIIRHPMYMAAVLFYVGLFLLTLSLISAAILVAGLIFYDFIVRYEERRLLEKFGREYEDYKKDVPRWVPRLKKRAGIRKS